MVFTPVPALIEIISRLVGSIYFFFSCINICSLAASPENIGHLFVVSFPNENQQANSQPFLVVIPKINATINVTVQMPLRNDLLRPIAKTLTNGRSATILLPATVRMTGSSTEANGRETKLNKTKNIP